MDTISINRRLCRYKNYLGTFPCDKIKSTAMRPIGLIVNTDNSFSKGEHWVAIFLDEYCVAEYFDSFGLPPLNKEIVSYLNKNTVVWKYNPYQFQGNDSETCGSYCIYFIEQRILGLTFEDIVSILSRKCKQNDSIIVDVTK